MKKFASLSMALAMLAIPVISSFADYSDGAESGYKILDGTKTARVTEYVGGGVWNHGISIDWVYSNYNHASKTHSATTTTKVAVDASGWKSANVEAKTGLYATLTGNKVNWNVK